MLLLAGLLALAVRSPAMAAEDARICERSTAYVAGLEMRADVTVERIEDYKQPNLHTANAMLDPYDHDYRGTEAFPNPIYIAEPLDARLRFLDDATKAEITRLYTHGAKVTSLGEMRNGLARWLSRFGYFAARSPNGKSAVYLCLDRGDRVFVINYDTGSIGELTIPR